MTEVSFKICRPFQRHDFWASNIQKSLTTGSKNQAGASGDSGSNAIAQQMNVEQAERAHHTQYLLEWIQELRAAEIEQKEEMAVLQRERTQLSEQVQALERALNSARAQHA